MGGRVALGVKRALDVTGAALGLAVLSPLLAAVAVAIRATLGAPVLFRQVRPGLHGRPFTILKFRTMRDPRPGEVWYLTNEQRLGRLGRFLRTSSLDELPELWNVLRGEMSLVGPRPLLVHYLETYTPEEARRHDVRPGITGWAAVNGRHAIRFKERLALDVWYVDHWSLGLDLRILARTLAQVVARKDVAVSEDLSLGFPLPAIERGDTQTAEPAASRASPAPPAFESASLRDAGAPLAPRSGGGEG
jgi:lipopolysaccharide/colanic/teichoic acid biosynthesis glycosyltransferase